MPGTGGGELSSGNKVPSSGPGGDVVAKAPGQFKVDFANVTEAGGIKGLDSTLKVIKAPKEGAVEEFGKPGKPPSRNAHDIQYFEQIEQKGGQPPKPNEDNATCYVPNNDHEPEGNTQPDNKGKPKPDARRKHAAMTPMDSDPQPGPKIDKSPGAPRKKGINGFDSDYLQGIRTRPKEGAVDEVGKPVKPPNAQDVQYIEEIEQKDGEVPKPPERNAREYVSNNDDALDGNTQPDDKRRPKKEGHLWRCQWKC